MVYIIVVFLIIFILLSSFGVLEFELRIIIKDSTNYSFYVLRLFWGLIDLKFNITLSPLAERLLSIFRGEKEDKVQSSEILEGIVANAMKGNRVFSTYIPYIKKSITKIRLKQLNIFLELGLGDAAQTALISGTIITIFASLKGYLNKKFQLNDTHLNLDPNFHENKFDLDLNCIIDIKLGHIIIMGIKFLIQRIKGGEINGRTSY